MAASDNINRAQFTDDELRAEHKKLNFRLAGMPLGVAGAIASVALIPPPLSIGVAAGAMAIGKKIYGSDDLHEDHSREFERRFK